MLIFIWFTTGTAFSLGLLALASKLALRPSWAVPTALIIGYSWPLTVVLSFVWSTWQIAKWLHKTLAPSSNG